MLPSKKEGQEGEVEVEKEEEEEELAEVEAVPTVVPAMPEHLALLSVYQWWSGW